METISIWFVHIGPRLRAGYWEYMNKLACALMCVSWCVHVLLHPQAMPRHQNTPRIMSVISILFLHVVLFYYHWNKQLIVHILISLCILFLLVRSSPPMNWAWLLLRPIWREEAIPTKHTVICVHVDRHIYSIHTHSYSINIAPCHAVACFLHSLYASLSMSFHPRPSAVLSNPIPITTCLWNTCAWSIGDTCSVYTIIVLCMHSYT